MLWTFAIILIALWALALVSSYPRGRFIYLRLDVPETLPHVKKSNAIRE